MDNLSNRVDQVTDSFKYYMCEEANKAYIRLSARREFEILVEDIAKAIENWGSTPPNPTGSRARLAKEIRDKFTK